MELPPRSQSHKIHPSLKSWRQSATAFSQSAPGHVDRSSTVRGTWVKDQGRSNMPGLPLDAHIP